MYLEVFSRIDVRLKLDSHNKTTGYRTNLCASTLGSLFVDVPGAVIYQPENPYKVISSFNSLPAA